MDSVPETIGAVALLSIAAMLYDLVVNQGKRRDDREAVEKQFKGMSRANPKQRSAYV